MSNIAIFVSGSGSNAENIFRYFEEDDDINVRLFVSSSPSAFALQRAKKLGISSVVLAKDKFRNSQELLKILDSLSIDFIVLAGFLWLIPDYLIDAFPRKIINIHPSLLPKYGGKGMYGANVHKAVCNNNEEETGITIHIVDEHYDTGEVLFQATCEVLDSDTAETIADKVHQLEYAHFPKVILNWIRNSQ